MHIKPADRDAASAGASHSGGQLKEPSTLRKVRLGGGSSRVPSNKETTESPLRVLVSAIGQSIGGRTPLRKQSTSTSATAKNEAALCSSPASSIRVFNNSATSPQMALKYSASARVIMSASTPRKSSLSSLSTSSSSSITSTSTKKQSSAVTSSLTPVSKKFSAGCSFGSSARSSNNPTTPIARKGTTMPPRTPKAGSRPDNNPTTPVSKYSSIPTPGKKQGVLSTPISRQPTTPSIQRRHVNPTTPITKPTSLLPTTPVTGYNYSRTPLTTYGSSIPYYTPKTTQAGTSTLASPLQPRDINIPTESSRRLHFGINVSAMTEQENVGLCTPRAYSSTPHDSTYSFDKNRLAQIKARRNAFQTLLKSPAQRVRVPDSTQHAVTPRRPQVGDHGSTDVDESTRRRVANSLF